jgi:hypothetical protein
LNGTFTSPSESWDTRLPPDSANTTDARFVPSRRIPLRPTERLTVLGSLRAIWTRVTVSGS